MRTRNALAAAVLATAALAVAACSASTAPAPAPAAPAAAPKTQAPAVPDTKAAAKAAARQYFALYSAGQWDAAWQYLSAADQKIAPEKLYDALHVQCLGATAGMAYDIKDVTMAGKTAVITYTIPVLASLGSATTAMTWTRSGWKADMGGSTEALYSHGSLAADLRAAKAAGYCSGS